MFRTERQIAIRTNGLASARSQVISISADKVDPANEGKLVLVSGTITCPDTLTDPRFGVSIPNVRSLSRKVEMYQWEERRTTTRDGTHENAGYSPSYSYSKIWSSDRIPSETFKQPGHDNPDGKHTSDSWRSSSAKLGAFDLGLLSGSGTVVEVAVKKCEKPDFKVYKGKLYSGEPSKPEIGDYRVSYTTINSGLATVLAMQKGNGFDYFGTPQGGLGTVMKGQLDADTVFKMYGLGQPYRPPMKKWYILMMCGVGLILRQPAIVSRVGFLSRRPPLGQWVLLVCLLGISIAQVAVLTARLF